MGYRPKPYSHTSGRNARSKLYAPKDVRRVLINPSYKKGYVAHKESAYPREHATDELVWDHVQTLFKKYDQDAHKARRSTSPSFLRGDI